MKRMSKAPNSVNKKYMVDAEYESRDFWRDFMHHSWKPLCATIYVLICVFDFIIAPAYVGIMRSDDRELFVAQLQGLDAQAQVKLVDAYSTHYRWEPNTLKWGGLFHFSFGAILTGVAVTGYRGGVGSRPPFGG